MPVVFDKQGAVSGNSDRLTIELPTDRVVGKRCIGPDGPIEGVDLIISGPRFRIDAIKDEPLNLVVTSFMAREWRRAGEGAQEEFVEFTVDDIRRDLRALQELRIEMDPPRVRLEVELIDNLTVPLDNPEGIVEIDAGDIAHRLRRETAIYSPAKATIFGPAIGMEELTRRSRAGTAIFRVTLRATGNEQQVTGELRIIGGDELGLKLDPTPTLQMQLRPQTTTFTLQLPIVVDDLSLPPELRGRYRPERKVAAVRVSVSGNLRADLIQLDPEAAELQAWAADNLRLQAYVARPDPGVMYPEEMSLQGYLVPVGPLLAQGDRGQCLLEDPVVVKLRRTP